LPVLRQAARAIFIAGGAMDNMTIDTGRHIFLDPVIEPIIREFMLGEKASAAFTIEKATWPPPPFQWTDFGKQGERDGIGQFLRVTVVENRGDPARLWRYTSIALVALIGYLIEVRLYPQLDLRGEWQVPPGSESFCKRLTDHLRARLAELYPPPPDEVDLSGEQVMELRDGHWLPQETLEPEAIDEEDEQGAKRAGKKRSAFGTQPRTLVKILKLIVYRQQQIKERGGVGFVDACDEVDLSDKTAKEVIKHYYGEDFIAQWDDRQYSGNSFAQQLIVEEPFLKAYWEDRMDWKFS
jgi:hypothetical protein